MALAHEWPSPWSKAPWPSAMSLIGLIHINELTSREEECIVHTGWCFSYQWEFFLKFFWRTSVLFVGRLIPKFWNFGDVCPGFQIQGGSLLCMLPHPCVMDSSDSPLVQHPLTFWWPALRSSLFDPRTFTWTIIGETQPKIECAAQWEILLPWQRFFCFVLAERRLTDNEAFI